MTQAPDPAANQYTDADWRSFAKAFNRKTDAQRLAERLIDPDWRLTRSQRNTKRLQKSREVKRW